MMIQQMMESDQSDHFRALQMEYRGSLMEIMDWLSQAVVTEKVSLVREVQKNLFNEKKGDITISIKLEKLLVINYKHGFKLRSTTTIAATM